MALSKALSADGQLLTIQISGKFDFNLVQSFRNAYNDLGEGKPEIIIDLKEADYMDSSALGMLLNMRKSLGDSVSEIRIVNTNEQLKKIFQISRFDKKFTIE